MQASDVSASSDGGRDAASRRAGPSALEGRSDQTAGPDGVRTGPADGVAAPDDPPAGGGTGWLCAPLVLTDAPLWPGYIIRGRAGFVPSSSPWEARGSFSW